MQFADMEAVAVTGPDRLAWLHNLTTAPFAQLRPEASIEALILDYAGHVKFAVAALDDGERTWLFTDSGKAEPLAQFLESMRFMMRVEVAQAAVAAFGMMRSAAQVHELGEGVRAAAKFVWEDPWPGVVAGGTTYGVDELEHPGRGALRSVIVTDINQAQTISQALNTAGLTQVDEQAWDALRIADWRPRPNREIADDKVLPHELDWLRTAVSLNKGCFPGQETVAKVINMGRPPRRLVFLYLEGEAGPAGDLPEPGAAVMLIDGEAQLGVVTSVARHFELGPIALALVKRTVPIEAVLRIDGLLATQTAIVTPEGRAAASPAEIPGAALKQARRNELWGQTP